MLEDTVVNLLARTPHLGPTAENDQPNLNLYSSWLQGVTHTLLVSLERHFRLYYPSSRVDNAQKDKKL